jgi:hypothetical protein
MSNDIGDGIRDLIEAGAAPVTLNEIRQRSAAPAEPAPRTRLRVAISHVASRPRVAALAAAAAVIAGSALVASQLPSSATGRAATSRIILTAAMVRYMASQSRLALASSGRVVISYRDAQDGVLQDTGTDDISFSGHNWNDAFGQTFPASGGQPASTQFAINRIVNGQFYLYVKGQTDSLQWYRDTNPANHPEISVPDPRTALNVLEPSARFEVIGYQTISGMRMEELRATAPGSLPDLGDMPDVQPGEQVTDLRVWVDSRGVVHRMALSLRAVNIVFPVELPRVVAGKKTVTLQKLGKLIWEYRLGHPGIRSAGRGQRQVQTTTLTVSFMDIGQREVITAPAHSIPQFGLG